MSVEQMGGMGAVLADEYARASRVGPTAGTAVLVEGASDREAIVTLAKRLGRDLDREGVVVIPIAGATNIGRFLQLLGPGGLDVPLAGLCDEGEAVEFEEALREVGLTTSGFFTCKTDLEDELIRALGADRVLQVMEEQGDLRSFRSFQNQPAQRAKTVEAQIWRWLGNHKIEYAPLLVRALDVDAIPPPLQGLLGHIGD